MMNSLVNTCARWVGLGASGKSRSAPEVDRRVWVRHACGGHATCEEEQQPAPVPFAARVADISRGGARLVANRRLDPGSLLSVHMPQPDEENQVTLLACVLYVKALPNEMWTVGCRFASELDEEELQTFTGKRTATAKIDRRAEVRHPCPVRASCRPVRDEEPAAWSVTALDLSPAGVGLLVEHAVEPGEVLSIHLQPAAGAAGITMLATIVRVTARQGGNWVLGCQFIRRLDDSEMRTLLEAAPV